jgi:BirA family biotin operon repressor/biotin-[acetyl-CoA-carboxylase] ligase
MATLKHPKILTDLEDAGENGLPMSSESWFQQELELCREWDFRLKTANGRVSLEFDEDQPVPGWIQKETPLVAWDCLRVHGFLRVDSTNSEALRLAHGGAPGGTLVYAEEQTAGKGRKGRTWVSHAKTGLYFTLMLKPGQPRKSWPLLSHVASVSLGETLKSLSDRKISPHPLDIDLKWPNDVLLSGRKCAGILLEVAAAEGKDTAAVVGVGINVRKGSVPESLATEAVCLDEMAQTLVPRRRLLVEFLYHFQRWYLLFEKGSHAAILDQWKSMSSMWNGVRIWIREGEVSRPAMTCGLNEIGALLVRTAKGTLETIFAGDVSVRMDLNSKNF